MPLMHCKEFYFRYKSLICAGAITAPGYRCGYVGVPFMHPLFGEDYDSSRIRVHGDLTYADYTPKFIKNYVLHPELWWFLGFDCGHIYDLPDLKAAKKVFTPFHKYDGLSSEGAEVRTKEFVMEECRKLADQLLL